jgi:hypothetical protein
MSDLLERGPLPQVAPVRPVARPWRGAGHRHDLRCRRYIPPSPPDGPVSPPDGLDADELSEDGAELSVLAKDGAELSVLSEDGAEVSEGGVETSDELSDG